MRYKIFRDNNKIKIEATLSKNARKSLIFVQKTKQIGFLH